MEKKLIFLISTEGRSEEEIERETDAAFEKFLESLKKSGGVLGPQKEDKPE